MFSSGWPDLSVTSRRVMTNSIFDPPIDDRYFEDYVVGSVYEFGSILVQEEDILSFARQYDPQNFHVDPEKAKETRELVNWGTRELVDSWTGERRHRAWCMA